MKLWPCYEFVAVDRPLTEKELEAVRATSTRARIARTSFVKEYHFGNFKGNPDRLARHAKRVNLVKQIRSRGLLDE